MNLSEKTLAILKNYAAINQSILIREGNVLRTISPQKNVLGKATVTENFPVECAIYDLNRLLGVLSLFKDPELTFEENLVKIGDGKNTVKYVYADQSVIVSAPDKDIKLPSEEVSFELSSEQLNGVMKAAGVIGLPDLTFRGREGKLFMVAHDKKNPSSNEYSVEIAEAPTDFNVDYKIDNIKVAADDYKVTISSKMISHFEGANTGMEYWVACESTSSFS